MKFLLILALLAVSALAQIEIAWKGNVSLQAGGNDNDFDFRTTLAAGFTVPLLFNGAGIYSLAAKKNGQGISVDSMAAAAFQSVATIPPVGWVSWTNAEVSWTTSNQQFWLNFDASAASNFIAQTFVYIAEDNNGQESNIYYLKDFLWTTSAAINNDNIHGITLSGTKLLSSLAVDVNFFVASVKGQVSVNGGKPVVVTPKSLKASIRVRNFPFSSTSSKLKIVFLIATGSAQAQADGTIESGDAKTGTYFSIAEHAQVSGTSKSVTFNGWSQGDINVFDSNVQAKVSAKYGASASVQQGSISIDQSSDITWDPTIGSGNKPKTGLSGGAIAGIVIGVLVGVALIAVIIFCIVRRKH